MEKEEEIMAKKKKHIASGKKNQIKKLVSSPNELKAALFQEYKERLRKRKIRPDFFLIKKKWIKD